MILLGVVYELFLYSHCAQHTVLPAYYSALNHKLFLHFCSFINKIQFVTWSAQSGVRKCIFSV